MHENIYSSKYIKINRNIRKVISAQQIKQGKILSSTVNLETKSSDS